MRLRRHHPALHPALHFVTAIFLCVGAPYLVQVLLLDLEWLEREATNTAIASIVALFIGFWLHHSISSLPGTRESSGILPGYSIGFGVVLTVILLLRIDYSRSILVAGYGLAIIWFHLIYAITQRRSTLNLGIVEGGRTDLFEGLGHVRARALGIDDDTDNLDAIAADFRHDHSDAWEARMADFVLSGLPVYHTKDLYESLSGRADLEHLSENNFGSLAPLAPFQIAKSVIDRLIALPVLLLALPFLVIVGLAIRATSPGPALFRQTRVGYRGKKFRVFKFRTMRVMSPEARKTVRLEEMTLANDPRITPLGRFLRQTRIDELPQILNILRGEMSWIGPRPEATALSEWYQSELPFYRYRHVVFPGITGWAQVSQGHVTDVEDVRLKLQYDFYYIRNFSIWIDLLIIAKTLKTMFTGFGAR